ncbi:AbrB/MazE/SpoVT family DNA-binding domain-containing protein [Candidatus Peregrinibacteria bacterium]|nr:AbrB/MazE/SpoVT family DNA-binding domain-containing protein [Candidatus Peregrinibacteria bacterium]
MKPQILTISDRGQITLPKKYRDSLKIKYVTIRIDGKNVILEPLQTREEFFKELEEAEKDWEKHGGIPWETVMKKANLNKK